MHPINIQKHTVLAKSGEARSVIMCNVNCARISAFDVAPSEALASHILILVSGSAAFVVLE